MALTISSQVHLASILHRHSSTSVPTLRHSDFNQLSLSACNQIQILAKRKVVQGNRFVIVYQELTRTLYQWNCSRQIADPDINLKTQQTSRFSHCRDNYLPVLIKVFNYLHFIVIFLDKSYFSINNN